jgi:hypothetical protein
MSRGARGFGAVRPRDRSTETAFGYPEARGLFRV